MGEVPEDRCGYQTNHDRSSVTPNNICCWRPVWKNTERCIWHADRAEKPVSELRKANPQKSERLDGAILRNVQIEDLHLEGYTLAEVDFSSSNFVNCSISDSDIQKADFSDSNLVQLKIHGSSIKYSDFSGSNLGEAEIRDSTLFQVDFSGADFTMAKLSNLKGEGVDFSKTWFKWADFESSEVKYAIFEDALISNIDFKGTSFPEGEFPNAEADIAKFRGVDLSWSDFNGAQLQSADFTDTNARSVNFDGANLEDATFSRTELRDANLQDTRLYQTLFSDTRINSNTDFGKKSVYEDYETELGRKYDGTSNWEAAAWVYRRLQNLHEENAQSEKAREYHVQKEEAHRRDYWEKGDYFQWGIYTTNLLLTRHGESLRRVVAWSLGIILVCGLLYPFTGGVPNSEDVYQSVSLSKLSPSILARSFYYSMVTFTTLGYGDPAGAGAKILVGLESLAGTLLIALFVFVLGRRVAR